MSNKTSAVVKTNPRKAVMIGCGFVGSASVFALMQSGLFSEIVLIDADKDKAEGRGDGYKPRYSFCQTYEDICRWL